MAVDASLAHHVVEWSTFSLSSNLPLSSPPGLSSNRWLPGIARRAFMLPSHCAITQAELAASQSLLA
eukprot:6182365-Pyramimonas_sp.AAC.1